MPTIEKLKKFGVDVESGLKRCVNNEALFLRLVAMVPGNDSFNKLYVALENKNFDEAFTAAHSLKGILSNLSIDNLLEPVLKITELLRNKTDCDYSKYLKEIEEKRKALEELCK